MEYGPVLPKHLSNTKCSDSPESFGHVDRKKILDIPGEKDDGCTYGPVLPPRNNIKLEVNKQDTEHILGPQLTANTSTDKTFAAADNVARNGDDGVLYGPALPPGFKQKSAVIGPCRPRALPDNNVEYEYVTRQKEEIESRARVKKNELSCNKVKGNKKTEREEWMTELPPEIGKNFGLGARTFRTKEVNLGDRSVWTDTPSQREHKKESSQFYTSEKREKSKKEVDMEKYVSEHNKRYRSESLLKLHEKDQKKKKKTDGVTERRPFDRDVDLGVGQVDAVKRKSLIKQSTNLNSKFEHSKQGPTYL